MSLKQFYSKFSANYIFLEKNWSLMTLTLLIFLVSNFIVISKKIYFESKDADKSLQKKGRESFDNTYLFCSKSEIKRNFMKIGTVKKVVLSSRATRHCQL